MNLIDFEKATGRVVEMHFEENGKKWAQFYLGDTSKVAAVRKDITSTTKKEELSISICKDGGAPDFPRGEG